MVRKFTEEERRRQREQSEQHYRDHHSGPNEGTPCNWYVHQPKKENKNA